MKKNNDQTGAAAKTAVPLSEPTIQKIENYLSKHYRFRYNEVTAKAEWQRVNGGEPYRPITDFQVNSLVRELIKAEVQCSGTMVRNVLFSDYTPVFNPFKSYLQGLPAWDGVTDHIADLASTVQTNNDPLWQHCFKKWFIAMVGSLMCDEVINHCVVVFSGKQGIGKTTWMLNLVPQQLKDYCFSGTINPGNKDTLIQLSECMLINLDELENLNRTELGAMKEIITKAGIRIRRPYGYSAETMPRRASFAGSVNGKEFLNDTTGSRRFLCFDAISIDYQHSISLDKVYAQALTLFQSGFQHWFSPADIELINKNNEQYRTMSVEEELLLSNFEPCALDDAEYFYSTTELVNWFSNKVKMNVTDSAKQKLGKALRSHGYLRIKRQGRYVYALLGKDPELVEYQTHFSPVTDELELTG